MDLTEFLGVVVILWALVEVAAVFYLRWLRRHWPE